MKGLASPNPKSAIARAVDPFPQKTKAAVTSTRLTAAVIPACPYSSSPRYLRNWPAYFPAPKTSIGSVRTPVWKQASSKNNEYATAKAPYSAGDNHRASRMLTKKLPPANSAWSRTAKPLFLVQENKRARVIRWTTVTLTSQILYLYRNFLGHVLMRP